MLIQLLASFRRIAAPGEADTFGLRRLTIGLLCVAGAAAARLGIEQLTGALVPFLFTFPAVIAATLLGGGSAGWTALIGCQALSYAFVLPHWLRDHGPSQQLVTFTLSTASAGATIWATAAFQRSSDLLRRRCERQVDTLSLLISEMDHRTKNSFQLSASLLSAQGLASADPRLRAELDEAASRLVAIASVYQSLCADAASEDLVSLQEHLDRICSAVRVSLLPAGIELTLTGEDVQVSASTALPVGLAVNEWITNAIKHAFAGGAGKIDVHATRCGNEISVEVRDDGIGSRVDDGLGGGSRLVPGLVATVHGRIDQLSGHGTARRLIFPAAE